MNDLLIKNGLVFTYIHEGYHALKLRRTNVLIEDGRIARIAPGLTASCDALDAEGCMVLPGFVNMGSCAVASRLLSGLLPDKNLERFGGAFLHDRILPVMKIAKEILATEQLVAIAMLSLFEGLRSGTTTAADLCDPSCAGAVRAAGEKLGMRLFTVPVQTREDAQAAFCGGTPDPRFAYAAYSEATRNQIRALRDAELLDGAVVGQCVEARPLDRELLHAAGASAAISAVSCVQEGRAYPGVDFLRSGVNTALSTGFYGNCMLAEMRAAAFSAKQAEGNAAQYKATDAFYAATCAGARALKREELLGRVDIGMSGDVSVVDMERFEPLSYPFIQYLYGASASDVRHVVCGGAVRIRDAQPEAALRQELGEAKQTANSAILAVWEEARRTVW